MNLLKKMLVVVLCATMVFSIIPFGNVEAEAASTYVYPKISALKVPRIYQPSSDTKGMCHFNSIASIIAYKLGSYSYDGYSRTYSYGTDYAYSSDPIWQKMYDVNNGSMDPTYSFSKYPVSITTKKVSGNNSATYELIYEQLAQGNPVVVYGPYHASVVIGYTASTNSLDATKFSVMEISKDGNWWSNSKSYFDSYANAPKKDSASGSFMPCYVTLASWLSYCDLSISRISYCSSPSVYINTSSDKYSIKSTNAVLCGQIDNPKSSKVSKIGIKLYDNEGNLLKNHSESSTLTDPIVYIWFDINSELGYTLSKGTTYKYQLYAVVGGTTYNSRTAAFTTTGTAANILSVYYNANGGSISSDTYYLSSNNIYKTSDNSKFIQKWTYNEAKENGLYDDTTFGIYRTGYTFLGWSTSSSGGTVYDKKDNTILPTDLNSNIKNGNCSVTMYAVWEKEEAAAYTLTYDSNEGSITPSPVTSDSNGTVVLSDVIPERFGYSFVGWNETGDIDNGFYVPGQEIVIYEDTTLYAVWDEFECEALTANDILLSAPANVVYIKFVPEVTTAYCFKTYSTEDNLDTIGALYDVNGTELVSDDDSGDGNNFMFYYTLYAGEIYYIKVTSFNSVEGRFGFEIIPEYIITYDANGGEIILDNSSLQQISDVAKSIPSIEIIRDGYTFIGWSENSNTAHAEYTEGDELNVNGNTTLYAVWQKNGIASGDEDDDNSTLSIDILAPSTTKISYKDGIVLHTAITGEIPEGASIVWEASNNNFEMHTLVMNTCGIISKANGNTVITVKIVNENGEILAQDSQIMTSNAGFFQKIIVFFKEIFGILPKVLPQAFKASF